MNCGACGRPLDAGARFCPACGTPTADACRSCGAPLPADARFCAACGAPSDRAPAESRPSAAVARERKIATILFADIVGFTGLAETYDPELVQGMVSSAFDRLSAEVARYEGIVEKFAGDAVLALFGVPAAHEDDPERAVRAALEMQAAFIVQAQELAARGRPELQLRIGIETGEVLVDLERVAGERERMVTGDPVNTAARLQSVAGPGAIVVGPGTYASTREVVEYEELEPLDLKGKALPVPAWRAIRVKARRGGIRTPLGIEAPLIGRDEELSLLKETVRRLTADRRPHLVTVIGSAGVGKSRLTWELEKYLDGLPETYHWRKGRYLSYGQTSFGGLVEVVRADAGVRDDDTEDDGRRRVGARLAALGLGGDEAIERAIGALLGATSEAASSRDDLFEAWRRYLEAIARVAPLVLVLEDIHWADEGSLDFVDFLARWAEAPILVLGLARHELLERRPSWGGGIANSSTIVLEPLVPAENAALLDALLPGSLPPGFKERIVAVAEGNPLFSEELVRMLIDRGIARPGPQGWQLVAPVEELDIPTSIHALLAARLDSLPAQEKRLTQAAAVVGRVFWDAVLAHVVAGASPDLDRLLRGLRVKELVVTREPSSLADSREYGFRHVLIRDVAYESVPKAERAEKHLQVADWAEQRLAREDEMVELLASHYRSALAYREEAMSGEAQLTDIRRRLLEYSRRAGRRAAELWDASSAAAWLRVAIEQARRLNLPATERAELAKEYLDSAITGEPVEDALAIGQEAVELLTAIGDDDVGASPVLAGIRGHLGQLIYGKGRPDEARAMLEDALAAIEGGPPTEARARLRWRLGWLTWRAFSPPDAIPILERAVDEAQAVDAPEVERRAVHDLGIALEYTGRSGEGLAMMERSMEMARAAGDHELMLRCYINLPAFLETATWDNERAEAMMREGLDRARRGGQRAIACFLLSNLSSTIAEHGHLDEAGALLEEARSMALEVGDENLIGLSFGFTAFVMARYGRLSEARRWHAESLGHGAPEPQGSGLEAELEAMLAWETDPRGAVSTMAARLGEIPRDADALRMLARMAIRTGQTQEALAGHEPRTVLPGAPRLEAHERWRTALLGPATEQAVTVLGEVAEQFLSGGYVIAAADALADAALVARPVSSARSAQLAERSRQMYREHGVEPLVGVFDEGVSALPEAAAGRVPGRSDTCA